MLKFSKILHYVFDTIKKRDHQIPFFQETYWDYIEFKTIKDVTHKNYIRITLSNKTIK